MKNKLIEILKNVTIEYDNSIKSYIIERDAIFLGFLGFENETINNICFKNYTNENINIIKKLKIFEMIDENVKGSICNFTFKDFEQLKAICNIKEYFLYSDDLKWRKQLLENRIKTDEVEIKNNENLIKIEKLKIQIEGDFKGFGEKYIKISEKAINHFLKRIKKTEVELDIINEVLSMRNKKTNKKIQMKKMM